MPMQRERYPINWPQISLAIREAAGWTCEWCGAKQGDERLGTKGRHYRVILTVAHLGAPHPDGRPGDVHDKMDVRRENLAALCQPCHLRYDMPEHRRNFHENRRKRQVAAGQQMGPWAEATGNDERGQDE